MFYIDGDVTRMTSLPRLELVLLAVSTIILSLTVVVHYEAVASTLEAQIATYLLSSANVDANRHQCNPNGGLDYSTIDLQPNPSNGNHPNSQCIPTFNILLSQSNLTLIQGSSRSLGVSLSATSELSPPITLSAESVPTGVAVLFAPSSGRSSFSSLVTIVAEQNHLLLAPLARYTTSLSWNPTGFAEGVYSIVVNVRPAPGEVNLSDENFNVGQLSLGPRPTAQPSPTPAAPGEGPSGLSYGRELAIIVALGEVIAVLLVFVRRRSRISKK